MFYAYHKYPLKVNVLFASFTNNYITKLNKYFLNKLSNLEIKT